MEFVNPRDGGCEGAVSVIWMICCVHYGITQNFGLYESIVFEFV